MTKIIHISDIHMCPRDNTIYGLDPLARLQEVVDDVNSRHSDAHLCVITGDLADAGDELSYHRLRQCLDNLAIPFSLTVGNHDKREAFSKVFGSRYLDENGFVQSVVGLPDGVRVILLDTLDEEREDGGILCPRRLNWLTINLSQEPETETLLFFHHPPADLGEEYFRGMLLANGSALFDLIGGANVSHLGFGHVHFSVAGRFSSYSFSSTRGTCQTISSSLQGRHASIVARHPSYNVILRNERGIVVHHVEPLRPGEVIGTDVL